MHFEYEIGQFRNLHSSGLIGGWASWNNVCGRGWMSRTLILWRARDFLILCVELVIYEGETEREGMVLPVMTSAFLCYLVYFLCEVAVFLQFFDDTSDAICSVLPAAILDCSSNLTANDRFFDRLWMVWFVVWRDLLASSFGVHAKCRRSIRIDLMAVSRSGR